MNRRGFLKVAPFALAIVGVAGSSVATTRKSPKVLHCGQIFFDPKYGHCLETTAVYYKDGVAYAATLTMPSGASWLYSKEIILRPANFRFDGCDIGPKCKCQS